MATTRLYDMEREMREAYNALRRDLISQRIEAELECERLLALAFSANRALGVAAESGTGAEWGAAQALAHSAANDYRASERKLRKIEREMGVRLGELS